MNKKILALKRFLFTKALLSFKTKNPIILSILFIGLTFNIMSQTHISGMVTDDRNNPLSFLSVHWKGTTTGVTTNSDGFYTITKTNNSDTLSFSFIGFNHQNIYVADDTQTINITMIPDIKQLDEAVIIERSKSEIISKSQSRKTEKLTTSSLERLPCCHLAASFENTLSVDKTYTDAVTGTEEIKMLGLAGVYSLILSEEVPIARGLSSSFGLHIPGAFLRSISISQGVGSVISGYEGITGQIQMFLKQPENTERFFVNLYGSSFGTADINLFSGWQLSEKWSTMLMLHGSSHYWKFDNNKDGFIDSPIGTGGNITQTFKFNNDGKYRHQFGYRLNYKNAYSGQMNFVEDRDKGTTKYYGVGIINKRFEAFSNQMFRIETLDDLTFGVKINYVRFEENAYFGLDDYVGKENNLNSNFNVEKKWSVLDQKLNFGGSFMYDNYDENLNNQPFKRDEKVPGIFAEYTVQPIDNITLIAGLRCDFHNLFGTFITPRFHFKYNASENTVFRLLAGKGYRTADPIMDNIGLMASSKIWVLPTNINDLQEAAWSYGANISHSFKLGEKIFNLELDYYSTEFSKKLITDLDTDPGKVLFYSLDGRSFSDIYQAQLSFDPFKNFQIKIAGRYNNIKETYNGVLKDKLYSPKMKGLLVLSYATRFAKWQLDVTNQFIGKARLTYLANAEYKNYSPAFYQLHAQITRRLKYFDVYLAGENLTNYTQKHPIISADHPFSPEFDATRVWAPILGSKISIGIRIKIK